MSIDCDRVIGDIVSERNACVTCGDHGHDLCLPDDREDMLTASNKKHIFFSIIYIEHSYFRSIILLLPFMKRTKALDSNLVLL